MAEGDLPKLGGRAKDIIRAQQARMERPMRGMARSTAGGSRPLSGLVRAERLIGRLGKSQVGRILKFAAPLIRAGGPIAARVAAVANPVGAVVGTLLTAKLVYDAAKEGHNAYAAHKDLERTREHLEKKYGNVQKAKATRLAMTKRNQ
jgi:hypothetical protein